MGKDTLFPTNNHHFAALFLSFGRILSGHYLNNLELSGIIPTFEREAQKNDIRLIPAQQVIAENRIFQ